MTIDRFWWDRVIGNCGRIVMWALTVIYKLFDTYLVYRFCDRFIDYGIQDKGINFYTTNQGWIISLSSKEIIFLITYSSLNIFYFRSPTLVIICNNYRVSCWLSITSAHSYTLIEFNELSVCKCGFFVRNVLNYNEMTDFKFFPYTCEIVSDF